ncbi:MAG: 2-oxoacid:ferredoxin oxidoreductase subunit gamma [Anaerolineaceae bacterium]|nr:MAG: 2-oxoacid:ferredoxin oxidoreductase subunit gamma [Anaerolineaceae bacterium]
MHKAIVFAGFGGQGIMFIGQLLAYAAMDHGYHVTWIPSYGPEMRGGTANCFVVVSSDPIGAPVAAYPDVALIFNRPSFDKFEPLVRDGGLLVVNSSLVEQQTAREALDVVRVPATKIASAVGSERLTNAVLLGAMLTVEPILPITAINAALQAHMPAHRRDALAANIDALERGSQHVRKQNPELLNSLSI